MQPTSSTKTIPLLGQSSMNNNVSATPLSIQALVNGTVSNFTVYSINAGGTINLYNNGTTLNSVVFSTGAGFFQDTTHTDTITSGMSPYANTASSSLSSITANFSVSGNLVSLFGACSGAAGTGSYIPVCGASNFGVYTALQAAIIIGNSGTVSNMQMFWYSTSIGTLTLYKNGTATSLKLTSTGTSGYYTNTGTSISVSSGDQLSYYYTGTASTPSGLFTGLTFIGNSNVSEINAQFPTSAHSSTLNLMGELNSTGGTGVSLKMPVAGTCNLFRANASGAGTNTLLKNGTAGNQIVVCTGAGAFMDTTHNDTFNAGDLLSQNAGAACYSSGISFIGVNAGTSLPRRQFRIVG
jgi:hypothetical protein